MPRFILTVTLGALLMLGCGGEPSSRDGGLGDARVAANCLDTLSCADGCATDACTTACLEDATPAALMQISALLSCTTAAGCGEDDTCIQEHCGAEVAACLDIESVPDAGVPDASVDAGEEPFPNRIEGTSRDFYELAGLDSNATVVFVRDDAAGEAAGYPVAAAHLAFYRLESIEYRATRSFEGGGCVLRADETESFTNPSAFENNLIIERTPQPSGLYSHVMSVRLSVNHPMGETATCTVPPSVEQHDFEAAHTISQGIDMVHLTDGRTLVGSASIGPRVVSWDLHAAD